MSPPRPISSSSPIKVPSPLELPWAPYRFPPPSQFTVLLGHPPSGACNKSPCPHFSARLLLRTQSPHPHLCSTCGRAMWTPERSGARGSTPPGKVEVPTPGSAHMSLAGRFFPSTMRMDRELRLAIMGPRRWVLAPGESDASVRCREQPSRGRARAGLGAHALD